MQEKSKLVGSSCFKSSLYLTPVSLFSNLSLAKGFKLSITPPLYLTKTLVISKILIYLIFFGRDYFGGKIRSAA